MPLGTEEGHKISGNPTNYIFTGVFFFFLWKYSQCTNLRKNTNMQRREINHVKFYQAEPAVINIWVYTSSWTLPIYTLLVNVYVGLIITGPRFEPE